MKPNMYLIFGLVIVVLISGCSKVPKVEELNLKNLDKAKRSCLAYVRQSHEAI